MSNRVKDTLQNLTQELAMARQDCNQLKQDRDQATQLVADIYS